jgi:hypothetical protein
LSFEAEGWERFSPVQGAVTADYWPTRNPQTLHIPCHCHLIYRAGPSVSSTRLFTGQKLTKSHSVPRRDRTQYHIFADFSRTVCQLRLCVSSEHDCVMAFRNRQRVCDCGCLLHFFVASIARLCCRRMTGEWRTERIWKEMVVDLPRYFVGNYRAWLRKTTKNIRMPSAASEVRNTKDAQ